MVVSSFLIAGVGTWVTERVIEPRLGKSGSLKVKKNAKEEMAVLTPEESRGLKFTMVSLIFVIGILLWWVLPSYGFLRDADTGGLLKSPFLSGIVALIFLISLVLSIAYGIGARTLKNDKEIMKGMAQSMSTMGTYIVLVFFAAQFVAFFDWSNIGIIVAVKGAGFLESSGMKGILLMLLFVLIAALINLVMGSASAKWAIMAPVFIPMFMILGYSPEFVQVVYRIGDSVSNIISPMMSYFALIVAFVEKYDKRAGIGSVIALMLPYTIAFFLVWSGLLIIWMVLGIPVGPGAPIHLVP